MDYDFDLEGEHWVVWDFHLAKIDLSPLATLDEELPHYANELLMPAKRFIVNMARVRASHDILVAVVGLSARHQEGEDACLLSLNGKLMYTEAQAADPDFPKQMEERVFNYVLEKYKAYRRYPALGEEQGEVDEANLHYLLAGWQSREMSVGIRAFMQTVITGLWTAVEVLLSDVLTSVAVANPGLFPEAIAASSFQKLETLRAAYKNCFNSSEISCAVGDQAIDGLFLARNLFVHEMGVVEPFFRSRCKDAHLTQWANLPDGRQFPIGGKVVKCYADRNIQQALKLLSRVNDWLAKCKS